jgi:hypothetical protein
MPDFSGFLANRAENRRFFPAPARRGRRFRAILTGIFAPP